MDTNKTEEHQQLITLKPNLCRRGNSFLRKIPVDIFLFLQQQQTFGGQVFQTANWACLPTVSDHYNERPILNEKSNEKDIDHIVYH